MSDSDVPTVEAPRLNRRGAPPSYVSRATLATELDCAPSTVDEMVKRGVLPKPLRLSTGCVRWCWEDVEAALCSLKNVTGSGESSDPYMKGIADATKNEGSRDAA
jgi:predicted DNA-binding transcriptional regulator AlpA